MRLRLCLLKVILLNIIYFSMVESNSQFFNSIGVGYHRIIEGGNACVQLQGNLANITACTVDSYDKSFSYNGKCNYKGNGVWELSEASVKTFAFECYYGLNTENLVVKSNALGTSSCFNHWISMLVLLAFIKTMIF